MRNLPLLACLLLVGCSTTSQVDQVNAQRAQVDAECQSKGYKPNSHDYLTCRQVAGMNQSAVNGLAAGAATMPLTLLGAFLSDARLKEDIVRVGAGPHGLGLYRFRYRGGTERFVGVLAQEVERVRPEAVMRDGSGYLSVQYAMLGVQMVRWEEWRAN